MSVAELAAAVDGRLGGGADPDASIFGSVEHDSRKVGPGGLFCAIDGEHVDGHDFAAAAHAAGAAAVLASREVEVPCVVVSDVLAALAALARVVIERLPNLTVVGITGSAGKTSVKDLTAQVCAALGPTVATVGNFNNELGHPHTVCRADADTRYLVLELGARHVGDVAALCRTAPPKVGVVLNVSAAHLGSFGSLEAVAQAKGELAEAPPPDGAAVLNLDDERVAAMAARSRAPVIGYGLGVGAVRADDVVFDEGRARFTLTTPAGSAPTALRLHGRHHVSNALAAAAVGHALGAEPELLAQVLSGARVRSERRMDVFSRRDGVVVIDDSYNANPASMTAALTSLADLAGRRRVAVLGYMAELGDAEESEHRRIGRLAAEAGVEILVTVEDCTAPLAEAAEAAGVRVLRAADQDEAAARLEELLRPGDAVLVKGSRYRTWRVADRLRQGAVEEARA